jgi:hypothetical protein
MKEFRVVRHLVHQDVKQNLITWRILPLLALAMYLAIKDADRLNLSGDSKVAALDGALTRDHFWLTYIMPLTAGLMGASLAKERRNGMTLTILAQGVTRGQYLLSKLLGAATSAAGFMLITLVIFYAFAITVWQLDLDVGGVQYGGLSPYWLPIESLCAQDLFCASVLITTPAALSLVGVLAGLIVANEYVAMVSPPIFTILLDVLLGDITGLSVQGYLYIWYTYEAPRELVLVAPFLYWGVIAFFMAALCRRFVKREIV